MSPLTAVAGTTRILSLAPPFAVLPGRGGGFRRLGFRQEIEIVNDGGDRRQEDQRKHDPKSGAGPALRGHFRRRSRRTRRAIRTWDDRCGPGEFLLKDFLRHK